MGEKLNENEQVSEAIGTPKFDKESAHQESKKFLADLLLTDPQTQEKLFVATNVDMNDDGSVSVVCVSDVESDQAIMHTIYSSYVSKAKEGSDIPTVDKDVSSKIVGLDGLPIN